MRSTALDSAHPLPELVRCSNFLWRIQVLQGLKQEYKNQLPVLIERTHILESMAEKSGDTGNVYNNIYLGAAKGVRGLALLSLRQYWRSYREGKKGAEHLASAMRQDPCQSEVCLGLGQFEYYCSKYSGILRFFLGLPGDRENGLNMARRAVAAGGLARWPGSLFLALELCEDDERQESEKLALQLYKKFPANVFVQKRIIDMAAQSNEGSQEFWRSVADILASRAGVNVPVSADKTAFARRHLEYFQAK